MNPLLSTELLKLRTTRALWVASGLVVTLAAALPVVHSLMAGSGDVPELTARTLRDAARAPVQLAGAAVLLVGLLATAGEYRHRTVLLTRLVEPRATRVLAAKLGAAVVVGLGLGVLVELVAVGSGAAVLAANGVAVEPLSHGIPRIAAITPLVLAAYGVLGVAVGALVRSTAGAVGVAFGWAFVVEGVVPLVLARPELGDHLPTALLKAVLAAPGADPGPVLAAGLLAVYMAVLVAAAAALDARREP